MNETYEKRLNEMKEQLKAKEQELTEARIELKQTDRDGVQVRTRLDIALR